MPNEYPPPSFHFRVDFYFDQEPHPVDIGFQEVTGLSVELETEQVVEGGENLYTHELPVRTRYQDLVLKRGLAPAASVVFDWIKRSLEAPYLFEPVNLTVALLNEEHNPLARWNVINAYPKKWEVSAFNAEQSSIAIETLTLKYQLFTQERDF